MHTHIQTCALTVRVCVQKRVEQFAAACSCFWFAGRDNCCSWFVTLLLLLLLLFLLFLLLLVFLRASAK